MLSEGELEIEPTVLVKPTPMPNQHDGDGAADHHGRRKTVAAGVAMNGQRLRLREPRPAFPSRPREAWQDRAPSAGKAARNIDQQRPCHEPRAAALAPEPHAQPRGVSRGVAPSKKPTYAAPIPISHRAPAVHGNAPIKQEPHPRSAAAAAANAAKMAVDAAKRARDAAANLQKRRDEQLMRANARNRCSDIDEVSAAQKIIDSFKRSQARRRAAIAVRRPAVADPPMQVRVTSNRPRARPPPRLLHDLHRISKPDPQGPSSDNHAVGARPTPTRVGPSRERIGAFPEKAKPVPTIAELKSRFEEANTRAKQVQSPNEHLPIAHCGAPSKVGWIAHLEPEEQRRIIALIHEARACAQAHNRK